MNVWYINSMLGTLRLEEEDDALCGVQLCPDGVPDLEPLPRKVCVNMILGALTLHRYCHLQKMKKQWSHKHQQ